MSVSVTWGNSTQDFLLYTCEGKWSIEELALVEADARKLVDSLPASKLPITTIVDLSQGITIPRHILPYVLKLEAKFDHRRGVTVVVGANQFARMIVEALRRLNNRIAHNVRMVSDMESALMIVQEINRDRQISQNA